MGRVEEMLAKQGAALSNGDKPANAASKEAAKELARTGTSTYKEKSYSAPVKVQKKKSKTTSSTTTTSKGSPGAAGGRVEAMLAEKGASLPKEKAAKTTAQPVKKTAAPLKAPKTTAKKVIRVPVKQTDPSAYGYDPMVAQDLENRQKQTSALKPGAKPFSAGKLAGDLAMRGMNLFAGFFSSGLAMAEDAGGYAAGLLTGQPGVNLAEGGIFNTWDQAIKREGQAMEQSAAKNVAKGGKAAETVYKYGTQAVAAMPQAVLAMLTGGGSAVASSASLASTAAKALSPSLARTISQAVSGMAKNPQYWTSFAQVVGPGYQQALEDGADHAHAALYAVGNGLLNAAVEIGGGVQKLPGALKGGTQTWKAIVDSMLEEGQEEVVQGIIERALQNVAYDQKNPLASASNPRAVLNPRTALEEFKGGAVVGGILGGGQAAVQAGINSYAQNQVQKHLDMMQSIVKERAAEIQSIQKQAEQEARDWVDSLDLPRPVDINAVNAQADQDASAIVRDMFSQKPQTETDPLLKIIQDIQRDQQAGPGSILLNGDQLTQINQEIAKQQASTVDVDSLLKGRARLDYEQLSPDTQAAVDRAYEQGTAGMDAEGRIFRIHPEDHIDRRDAADIGRRRSLNAFQFDHPELHRFFAGAAQWLKSGMGQKGGQIESTPGVLSDGVTPSSHDRYWRTSRMQPEPVVRLLDEFGLSYAEIDKALDAIIKDKGQENYAAAKKVELVLDEMLTNGWTDLDGRFLPGIPEYVDATSKIAGSLNAEQEPDLGIMGQEIERLYGKQDAAPLTPDGQNGTIQETPETEESAYERREQERKEAYPESREDFLRRRFQPLEGIISGGETAFRFRKPQGPISSNAQISQEALTALGVPSVIVDGRVEINRDNTTVVRSYFEGGTMAKQLVAISNYVSSPLETAAHEAVHFWAGSKARQAFQDVVDFELIINSDAFAEYQHIVSEAYFGGDIDVSDLAALNDFMEEFYAFIAGQIHSGEYESMLRPMFRDYDAVKAAWNQLAEYGRSHPAEMPPSIQWGQETGPDLGILGREIERLYGKQDAAPLTPDGQNGTIQETPETEETPYENRTRAKEEARPEGRREFLERSLRSLSGSFESGDVAFGFRTAHAQPQQIALGIRQALTDLGVPCEIIDGHVEINFDGYTQVQSVMQTACAKGKLVFIGPEVFGHPMNAAGHEAFHFWRGSNERIRFEEMLRDQIIFTSDAFMRLQQTVSEDYFGGEVFLSDELQTNNLMEEILAFISGNLHSGEHEAELRSMLRDYDAVKSAWNQLAEYGRSHPAEMPPSIQWGQETGPDLGILGREIDRLYGKSDTTPSDGLGAADAGTVNTDYDRLQAQSSEFHPEGENPARPVDVPVRDFDGRDIAKSASTIMGAKAIPDEVIPMIEQMIADGEFSHDRISNAASLSRSREKIQTLGFDAALESYRNDIQHGVASKDTFTLGQLLLVNAANAEDGPATAELLSLISASTTNAAQALQAQSILRKLDPEYQLYAAQKAVDNLNRANDRRAFPVKGITAADALAAYQNVVDAMRDAFQEIANAERGTSPRSWVEQLSQDLARNVENRAFGSKNQSASIYSTLLNDLNSLMHNFVRTERGEVVKRSASDKIADLFANRAEYARAWEQAKNVLRERYGNDPQALDTLEDFLNSTMNYNGTGSDSVMMRAVAEAALENDANLKELVIRGEYDLDALAGQITDTMLQKTNASGPDVAVVQDAVRRYIQNKRESAGKTASRYIHSDIQKTIREIGTSMAEIIRSGADSKANVLNRITSALIQQYGISQEAAPRIAEAIAQDYEATVKERAKTRLETIFKDRPKKTQRSVMEKFEEMVNLGAFSGNEFNNKAVRKLFGLNTGAEISPELIQKFLDQTDQKGRDAVMNEIVQSIASQTPSSFRAKLDSIRFLSMLFNSLTHFRNLGSNFAFQIPASAKNRAGAAIEAGYNLLSGGKLERTKSFLPANPFGQLAKEARADWKEVGDLVSGTHYDTSNSRGLAAEVQQKANPFEHSKIPGLKQVGKLSLWNKNALAAEDNLFKSWIYSQSLAGYLKANGIKSISDADPQLLNRARNYAAQEALRNTFNDHNMVADAVASLGGWYHDSGNPFKIAAGTVVEGALPFKRTTANVAIRSTEYSPVGAIISLADAVYRGVTGTETVDTVIRRIDRVAAALSGTALVAAGALLSSFFTGGGDDDEKQRAFDDLTGHQNWALELKNGVSATFSWVAPTAIPFFMGVELAHKCMDGGVSFGDFWETIKDMREPMLEMSLLQSLNDMIEDASYAKNNGGDYVSAIVFSALTSYATQFFPTVFGALERSAEDKRMSTFADPNSPLPKDMQFFLGKVSKKIPGWDYHQIPYIDEWGREESNGDPVSRAFNNILNPAYMSQVQIDNVEKELQRLKDTTGSSSVFPAKVDKSFKVGDEMKYLTADEYTAFAKTVGQTRYSILQSLVKHQGYKKLSDEDKAETISVVYKYANEVGKAAVSDFQMSDTYRELLQSPMDPATFFLYKRMMSIEDDKQQTSAQANANVRNALKNDSSLSAKEKNILDDWIISDVTIIPQHKDVDYSSDESFALSQMSDSAQQHWEYVRDRTGISSGDYQTAWSICNRSEKGYHKEDRIRDLMNQLGISKPEANRIWNAVKKDLDE